MPHNEVRNVLRTRAKQLRRAMTRPETMLWRHLKAHRLAALGFRRQSPMGNYIADFVAHSCRLVVELDGESNDFEQRLRYDRRRDQWFAARGYRVLRFTNDDVTKNLEGVVLAIAQAAEHAAPRSLTLPRKGGGSTLAGRARQTPSDPEEEAVIVSETSTCVVLPPPLRGVGRGGGMPHNHFREILRTRSPTLPRRNTSIDGAA